MRTTAIPVVFISIFLTTACNARSWKKPDLHFIDGFTVSTLEGHECEHGCEHMEFETEIALVTTENLKDGVIVVPRDPFFAFKARFVEVGVISPLDYCALERARPMYHFRSAPLLVHQGQGLNLTTPTARPVEQEETGEPAHVFEVFLYPLRGYDSIGYSDTEANEQIRAFAPKPKEVNAEKFALCIRWYAPQGGQHAGFAHTHSGG